MEHEKKHFTRAPTLKQFNNSLKRGVKKFYLPKSAVQRLSFKVRKKIKDHHAEIIVESARGRPLELNIERITQIIELHRDDRTFREIEKITGIPRSTAHYLIKYAERQKLKRGKKVIYI